MVFQEGLFCMKLYIGIPMESVMTSVQDDMKDRYAMDVELSQVVCQSGYT